MSTIQATRWRRKMRVRKRISGTAERPRLSVFRSNVHMYAQIIDDTTGATLSAASTTSPACRERLVVDGKRVGKKDAARIVGTVLAEFAKAKGIEKVVFDRGTYRYHGRVKALADGAREGGLKF